AAVTITTGMMKSHPSGARRIRGMATYYANLESMPSGANLCDETRAHQSKGVPFGTPFSLCHFGGLLRDVARLVGPNPRCHLILQLEFALLQRFLFELFLDGHLGFGGQFAEA
ncbi:MAG TPA: hypothetical protein VKH35_08840, partial [Thermoanaerobaculia bacterium]|nr:hypothetical protein [Thermoanaerobaculia bacterium]